MTFLTGSGPRDYGLPYDEWWVGQKDAVDNTLQLFRDYKTVFLLADTGTGKTGIATAIAHAGFDQSTVLCPTISLEEQYGELTGIEVGRGRGWWKCYKGGNAQQCYEADDCSGSCEYKAHMGRVINSNPRIMNYAQFLAVNQTPNGFPSDLVVCDEGHGVEDKILGFVDSWTKGNHQPTWGYEVSEYLINHTDKLLIMSASMVPSLIAETMGIEHYAVYEAENDFPVEMNPLFCKPVGFITSKKPYTDRIAKFVADHMRGTTMKGVIHMASDRQTEELMDALPPEMVGRLIWPKGRDRADAFRAFKSASDDSGATLISASSYEGQDFPDDECRWQIITKVPYASLGSPHVQQRRKERPDVYRLEALQKIQQMCGRGMRNKNDWCMNYILDATFLDLFEKLGDRLSGKFRSSVIRG